MKRVREKKTCGWSWTHFCLSKQCYLNFPCFNFAYIIKIAKIVLSQCTKHNLAYISAIFVTGFFGFYLIVCRTIRATIWANFCAIWSTGSKVIAFLLIFNSLFSLYLNQLLDSFFCFYPILCRKIRATIWASNLTIWSTGSRDITFLVILCSFLLLFSFSSSNFIIIAFNKI